MTETAKVEGETRNRTETEVRGLILKGRLDHIVSKKYEHFLHSYSSSIGNNMRIRTVFDILTFPEYRSGFDEKFRVEFEGDIGSELVGKMIRYVEKDVYSKTHFYDRGC